MPMKICECCGTQFHARLSATRTCGVACRNRLIAAEKAEKHKSTKACPVCKSDFEATGANPHQQTCSQECGYKISSGDNKPNYKGLTELVVIDGVKKSRRTAYGSGVHNTMRRVSIALATPSWASQEKIRKIYELRAKIDEMTGIKHHVDHVVPLNSKLVCGLHNEFNLAVMLGAENVRKNNRHWPDMW